DSARGRSVVYAGLFSPRRARYEVSTADPGWRLAPVGNDENPRGTILAAETDRVADYDLDTWEMGAIRAQGRVGLGRGFSISPSRGAELALVNGSPDDLEDCALVWRGQARAVGPLRRGAGVFPGQLLARWPSARSDQGLFPRAVTQVLGGTRQERHL